LSDKFILSLSETISLQMFNLSAIFLSPMQRRIPKVWAEIFCSKNFWLRNFCFKVFFLHQFVIAKMPKTVAVRTLAPCVNLLPRNQHNYSHWLFLSLTRKIRNYVLKLWHPCKRPNVQSLGHNKWFYSKCHQNKSITVFETLDLMSHLEQKSFEQMSLKQKSQRRINSVKSQL
jgi:hypothetical protein